MDSRLMEFEAVVRTLPLEALAELEQILTEANAAGVSVDAIAIANALWKSRVVDPPRLPARYATREWIEASHGRDYELGLDVDHTDAPSVLAMHERYLTECRRVDALIAAGSSLLDAWEKVRREVLLGSYDLPRDRPSKRHHRNRSQSRA